MAHYTTLQISDTLKQDILTNIIEPEYKEDIATKLLLKKKYSSMGLTFETLSKIFIGVSSITSFSSGIYRYQVLAFLAGASSVMSLMFLQFSSYSFRESKLITDEINLILSKLNLPSITVDFGSSDK